MPLLLMQLAAHPDEIAASMSGECLKGGAFFLDFSRPLGRLRWLGAWNRRIGMTMSLLVPVVHQHEVLGTRSVTVDRGDAYFGELQRLWAERHPATRTRPAPAAADDPDRIARDFAAQFPHERL